MTQETIIQMLGDEQFTLTDVIDAVIDLNGIVGVGLITLGDQIQSYIYHHKTMRIARPKYGDYGEQGISSSQLPSAPPTNAYGGEIPDPHTLG
jgi:hypothetical protein